MISLLRTSAADEVILSAFDDSDTNIGRLLHRDRSGPESIDMSKNTGDSSQRLLQNKPFNHNQCIPSAINVDVSVSEVAPRTEIKQSEGTSTWISSKQLVRYRQTEDKIAQDYLATNSVKC
jgi:hypothetical protein